MQGTGSTPHLTPLLRRSQAAAAQGSLRGQPVFGMQVQSSGMEVEGVFGGGFVALPCSLGG